jgi:putative nucleotidyltransferase with HDIG domain
VSVFNINLHELIYSLSDALDLVGVDHVHHGKRVAFMAAECAKALNWEPVRVDHLFQAAILHDCGVSNTSVHHKLAQIEWEQEQNHCQIGADILRSSPLLKHLSDTVLFHHTHWFELEKLDVPLEVKLNANCIYMVDRVDVSTLKYCLNEGNILLGVEEIRQMIHERRGDWFNAELVDVFLEVSDSEAFWLSLEKDRISGYVSTWVAHDSTHRVDFSELKSIVKIFSHIVDSKSTFTREHSDGVANLARHLAEIWQLNEQQCDMVEIAALLHDLGKLRVPDEILDKNGRLDEREYQIMKRHTFDTYNILSQVKGFEQVSLWAAEHHERVDGTGYPFRKKQTALPLEARIIAVADVFQALAQNRPYRNGLPPEQILKILREQADQHKLDADIVDSVQERLQECWRVALMKQPPFNAGAKSHKA